MITTINPKTSDIKFSIIFQVILGMVLLYLIYVLIFQMGSYTPHKKISIWFAFGSCLILGITLFLQLLFLPYKITIDDELNILVVKYVIIPTKTLYLSDIASYSNTTIKSKSSAAFGIFINLSSGKQILASDLTLDNYNPIEWFLAEKKVENLGEVKYSIFSYYSKQ
jgi:hypothetical protein